MANEAVVVENPSIIRDFTVADATALESFTFCQLSSDPRTVTASSGADIFAGINMTEKKTLDGQVNVGLAQDGIFVGTAVPGAGLTLGHLVVLSGANLLRNAVAAELLTGAIVGKCLETVAAGTTGEIDIGVRG